MIEHPGGEMRRDQRRGDNGQSNGETFFALLLLGTIALGIATKAYWISSIGIGVAAVWYWTFGPGRGHTMKTTYKRARGPEQLFTPFGSRWYAQHKVVPRPGWWQASDGKWYPPQLHPRYRRPPPPPRHN